jgi:phosphoribosylaminoimidazole-succinocarboxamide synthase
MITPIPTPDHSGKVRDHYRIDDSCMLMVASDRLSAHDVVFDQLIPGKGRVLTALTEFWLTQLFTDTPHHLVTTDMSQLPESLQAIPDLDGRGMIVRRAKMLPIECIVRGYLFGSVVGEYQEQGTACGVALPSGLVKSSQLPHPIFTPSTKATVGHDVNINEEAARAELLNMGCSPDLYNRVVAMCLDLYQRAAAHALARGIIIADTKFELGLIDGQLAVCDEVLTPDSSRFWVASSWEPGLEPESLDKQPIRNYGDLIGWNRKPPAPELHPDVIVATSARYQRALEVLTAA